MLASLKEKETYTRYFKTLKYAMYVITHPLDGFWDLTHEKRGSIAAANTIVFLTVLARIMQLQHTSFLFMQVYWEDINIFLHLASVLFPLALWCVGNWCLTTLFDGEGSFKDIFVATGYALAPLPLFVTVSTILSNILTSSEGSMVSLLVTFGYVWVGILLFFGMLVTHDYTINKNFITVLGTIVAMAIIMFVTILFSSLVVKIITFVIAIFSEVANRM